MSTTTTQARATARYVRRSPTKARQLTRLIQGEHVDEARRILQLSTKDAARDVLKVLNSAVANAEHNEGLNPAELVVTSAYVDQGPTLKRYQPRALGRAYRIRKRTCHISVIVAPVPRSS